MLHSRDRVIYEKNLLHAHKLAYINTRLILNGIVQIYLLIFHIRTVHLDIVKVVFIHKLMN